MTVAELIEVLKKLPQDHIICHGTSDGVCLIRGEAESEFARWKQGDDYVFVEYIPYVYDVEDEELYGPRRAVVVLR